MNLAQATRSSFQAILLPFESHLEAMATTGYTPPLSQGVGYGVVVGLGVVFALGMVSAPAPGLKIRK